MLVEAFGTFILVFFGVGSAVLMGGHIGMLGISLAFGISIIAAAYSIGAISGAHLNPAVSLGMVATFVFVTVILGATQDGAPAMMAGLAIGFTLAGIHLVGINVTGVSVNPARSIGAALFAGTKALADLWVFIAAPLIGGAAAGIVFKAGLTRASD